MLHIARYEGPKALYSGLVPGLQRQMAFSAIRIGGYENVKNKYMEMTGITGVGGAVFVATTAMFTWISYFR